MIDNGATTIWETRKESDNTYSNCCPMFCSVTEWFYRWLGGIRLDPAYPCLKVFTLAPAAPQVLDDVNCTCHSPFGQIISNWKREKDGISYKMKIPARSFANVSLPLRQSEKIEIRNKLNTSGRKKLQDWNQGILP